MRKLIGTKQFYRHLLIVALPIAVQNAITNFVGMLDNIMIGRIGTFPMSGVSIVNQLLFIFYLCIFGAMSGIGIFTAQFYGSGNTEGVRNTFRFKFLVSLLLTAAGICLFLLAGPELIRLFLTADETGEAAAEILSHGERYLTVMLIGIVPFAVKEAYASTLRECGETVVPMAASIAAVLINLGLNYVLIFGKFGAPALGVAGAAAATVISRFAEFFIVLIYAHTHSKKHAFIQGAFKTFRVPGRLVRQMIIRGTPLLVNETLWAGGMAALSACYASLGISVIPAQNIASTISNVFNISFIAMGSAIAIILGQELGAGNPNVREDANKLTFFTILISTLAGGLLAVCAFFFPQIYNTEEQVRSLATSVILIQAAFYPIYGFINAEYFTLRSGGKTFITFLFDSCYVWCVSLPATLLLVNFTDLSFLAIFTLVNLLDLIKCVIGFVLVRKGIWVNNLTKQGG